MDYRNLEPSDAQQELQEDPALRLLDVRTQPEHDSHRLADATLIPVQELAQQRGFRRTDTWERRR